MESTYKSTDVIAPVESLRRRLGRPDPRQIAVWRAMSPARRLEIAFQAYQFALDTVRLTERQRHPDLSPDGRQVMSVASHPPDAGEPQAG